MKGIGPGHHQFRSLDEHVGLPNSDPISDVPICRRAGVILSVAAKPSGKHAPGASRLAVVASFRFPRLATRHPKIAGDHRVTRNLLPASVFILSLTFCVSARADSPQSLEFAASTIDANCCTDEWKRSQPDFAVFLPKEFIGRDTDNVHFLVTVTPAGDLLSFWTQATYEAATWRKP